MPRNFLLDVEVLIKDATIPVKLSADMQNGGWVGGQGVRWDHSPNTDDLLVTYSDGTYGGFLLQGSKEVADNFTAYEGSQVKYGYAVLCVGTWVIATVGYEKYTLQSRMAGPLVENVFTPGERVRFSNRGLLTPEDEWTISGDPRAPNEFLIGSIIKEPKDINNHHLQVQIII